MSPGFVFLEEWKLRHILPLSAAKGMIYQVCYGTDTRFINYM